MCFVCLPAGSGKPVCLSVLPLAFDTLRCFASLQPPPPLAWLLNGRLTHYSRVNNYYITIAKHHVFSGQEKSAIYSHQTYFSALAPPIQNAHAGGYIGKIRLAHETTYGPSGGLSSNLNVNSQQPERTYRVNYEQEHNTVKDQVQAMEVRSVGR